MFCFGISLLSLVHDWTLKYGIRLQLLHSCNGCVFFFSLFCFVLFRSYFYGAGVVFVNIHSFLLCFHPKPPFLMHEGYVLWAVNLQIWKQIWNCIMLRYPCGLYHLQLYNTIQVMILEMMCIMISHLLFCDVINDTHILCMLSTNLSLVW